MDNAFIVINDVPIRSNVGSPSSCKGLFAGGDLAAIELDFRANDRAQIELVENLLEEKKVTVSDPFAQRSYPATIHLRMSSFQEGSDSKSYVIEVKEVDTWPQFECIELNGIKFDPVQYHEEKGTSGSEIVRSFLLKLSQTEFDLFQRFRREDAVQFKRVGADEDALELRIGGFAFWSEHVDGDTKYFKQVITLYPLNGKEETKLTLASGEIQANLAGAYVVLKAKFDLLLEELSANRILSEERKKDLLSAPLIDLVPKERIDELIDDLYKVTDAERKF